MITTQIILSHVVEWVLKTTWETYFVFSIFITILRLKEEY